MTSGGARALSQHPWSRCAVWIATGLATLVVVLGGCASTVDDDRVVGNDDPVIDNDVVVDEEVAVASTATLPTTSTSTRVNRSDQAGWPRLDFENLPLGSFSAAQLGDYWEEIGPVKYARVGDSAEIADDGDNRYLRIAYPKGRVGHEGAGSIVSIALEPLDERCVSYRIRFPNGFDAVKGGKLPGLSGGESNTGGKKPTGLDGWSARIMWRRDLAATQYVYHPDQEGDFGEDLTWSSSFPTDRWVSVETCVFMNTPGNRDGIVQSWMDGQLVLDRSDIRFRDTPDITIDRFLFSTFFGGSSSSWAPTRDEFIDFDDFVFFSAPAEANDGGSFEG